MDKPIWLDQKIFESWICSYCKENGHDPELAKHIQTSWYAEIYCSIVYDDPIIRNKITTNFDVSLYRNGIRKKGDTR